jgi:tRNA modification GTPase
MVEYGVRDGTVAKGHVGRGNQKLMRTIYALSSGRAAAGVAVVRVSGPAAHEALQALAGDLPKLRHATLRTLHHPITKAALDQALVLAFAAPHSATGEDMAELHIHGGVAVIDAVLAALALVPGLTLASPGDFTRRAFDNGKLDLAQVEGLADLIAAETEAQRAQALRQMDGALSGLFETWRQQLIEALAYVEADIDFADGEDDVPDGISAQAGVIIASLQTAWIAQLADASRGERLRDGFTVAITGPPNAGKSSLLNALAQRDVAIVSPIAGTTRDSIEVHLNLSGYPVTLIDTAGLRDTNDPVEAEGVRRARAKAAAADLNLYLTSDLQEQAPSGLRVQTKIDLSGAAVDGLAISTLTGAGLPELISLLSQRAATAMAVGEAPSLTRARHREVLAKALAHLSNAQKQQHDLVLAAEELRLAARTLGRITGRVNVEDVLEIIFSSFCIGK